MCVLYVGVCARSSVVDAGIMDPVVNSSQAFLVCVCVMGVCVGVPGNQFSDVFFGLS